MNSLIEGMHIDLSKDIALETKEVIDGSVPPLLYTEFEAGEMYGREQHKERIKMFKAMEADKMMDKGFNLMMSIVEMQSLLEGEEVYHKSSDGKED